ncbi:MAG: tetratricopeptide repeat protein [Methylococcales bacterium]
MCDALHIFLHYTGRWDEWLSLSQEAEAKALTVGDRDKAGWRVYQTGWVHYLQGKADAVLDCAERCTGHWREAGATERAYAIRLRGLGYRLRKEYPAAIAAYQEALKLRRSLAPESADVASGLNDLAGAKLRSGDLDGAEADYREALRIARKVGYRDGIATYAGNLAEVYLDRRDWPAAEKHANEALELAKALGRLELIAGDYHILANALLNQQRAAEALPHAREAVAIFTRLRHIDLAEARATLAKCEAAEL